MTLYPDDDTCDSVLVRLLRKAGHTVTIPADIGTSRSHDALHLLRCVREEWVLLSKNYKDFDPIHQLVIGCGGTHRGIVLIRKDDDRMKDLTPKGIVAALARLEQARPDLTNELVTLNDWR